MAGDDELHGARSRTHDGMLAPCGVKENVLDIGER
jgi:hypothetical protein